MLIGALILKLLALVFGFRQSTLTEGSSSWTAAGGIVSHTNGNLAAHLLEFVATIASMG